MTKHNSITALSLIALMLTSCATLQKAPQDLHYQQNNCNQQIALTYTKEKLPKPIKELQLDTLLTKKFSYQSLNTANAIGLLGVLSEYLNLKKDYYQQPTLEKKVNIIERSGRIYQKINIASLEVSAMASELDCEEERADQVAQYLKGKEDNNEKNLVIGSIIVGAAGTILSEALTLNGSSQNTVSSVAIGASLAEATLGVLMLTNKKTTTFYHKRNALKDIWTAPETSSYYPASVWYYLTTQNAPDKEKTLVKLLVDEWLSYEQIAGKNDKRKEEIYNLYFGDGGKYNAEQLKNRADMLDQVEAFITLMKQDLKVLSIEFERLNLEQ